MVHRDISNARPTIGFFNCAIFHSDMQSVWAGIYDVVRAHAASLVFFDGGVLRDPYGFKAQANAMYDLANPACLDGLILWLPAIDWAISPKDLSAFLRRFRSLPIVAGEKSFEGIPGILVENYQGMRDALLHLLSAHGYRRIAFIRGPEGHIGAQERYRAYLETLAQHHCLALDLIGPPGPWEEQHGFETVNLLLHERKVVFDAIACACDDFAVGAIRALRACGCAIPKEVAVTGFDDSKSSGVMTPPLTTARVSFYQLGRQAADALFTLLDGKTLPEQNGCPVKLMVRQSCGCLPTEVISVSVSRESRLSKRVYSAEESAARIEKDRAELAAAMRQAIGVVDDFAPPLDPLIDALAADVRRAASGGFLALLYDLAGQQIAAGQDDVNLWQHGISLLRQRTLPLICHAEKDRMETLWHQARILIGNLAQRHLAYLDVQAEKKAQVLSELGQSLITTFNVQELMDVLADALPSLGIARCFLAFYDDASAPPRTQARLVLAYDEHGRMRLESGGRLLTLEGLLSEEMNFADRPAAWLVEALYFRETQLGVMIFEAQPRDGTMYYRLRGEISSALQGALLFERLQERTAELVREKYVIDTFMASVPDSIYFKDRDSRFIRANPAIAELFGVGKPSELIGKTDFDFFPAEQADVKFRQEQEIVRTGQSLLNIEEPDAHGRWALTTKMPLRDEHGEIIGIFGISRDITPLKHSQKSLADAYEEIRVLNKQLRAENLRMSAELDISRQIQRMILPSPEELQQIEGLDIVGFMQPADEVGGDYYDVLAQNHGLIHLGIGDVTGHGLESGILMLMTQTAIRTLIEHGETDPIAFLATLNRTVYKNIQRMRIDKTLTLALIMYRAGTLKIFGQHEELLIVRHNGRVERVSTSNLGFPIGLQKEIASLVSELIVSLDSEDGIVLYTDGITEAESPDHRFYGIERLCDVLSRNWRNSAEIIKQAVISDVTQHIGDQKVYDDITLVVLKRK